MEFYDNNGSPVCLATLDASQAFDRVEYVKLFELLRKRKIVSHLYTINNKCMLNKNVINVLMLIC